MYGFKHKVSQSELYTLCMHLTFFIVFSDMHVLNYYYYYYYSQVSKFLWYYIGWYWLLSRPLTDVKGHHCYILPSPLSVYIVSLPHHWTFQVRRSPVLASKLYYALNNCWNSDFDDKIKELFPLLCGKYKLVWEFQ